MAKPPGAAAVTRIDRLPRRRRPRWLTVLISAVLLVVVLVVAADRGGVLLAQHEMAVQIKKEGFPATPKVTIKGIPFLTQVVSRHFGDVRLEASRITEGPLRITNLKVRARDVRVDSGFGSGTLGSVDGTAFVSFKDLASASDNPDLVLTAAGNNLVKAKMDLGITDATATATVTKQGNSIVVKTQSIEGFSRSDLGDDLDFTVPVKGLPMGLSFQSVTVSSNGVGLHVTGRNVKFSDS
ncbi:LmeA family phospholipid-binding protein [Actinomadura violacea]|uniref:DUF2993 domain-containing protein n=1 Tax=Actinomadura violacea TaxID=2819934 RepID=A0ABS3RPF3_9ACTN|nr:DUF2993 domain-containing protein [Actinomadura violacea]MBO2458629.1 DUF2993 domain-containing protein [Actinomadura violacea]